MGGTGNPARSYIDVSNEYSCYEELNLTLFTERKMEKVLLLIAFLIASGCNGNPTVDKFPYHKYPGYEYKTWRLIDQDGVPGASHGASLSECEAQAKLLHVKVGIAEAYGSELDMKALVQKCMNQKGWEKMEVSVSPYQQCIIVQTSRAIQSGVVYSDEALERARARYCAPLKIQGEGGGGS